MKMSYELKIFTGPREEVEQAVTEWVNTLPDRVLSYEGGRWAFNLGEPDIRYSDTGGILFKVTGWALVKESTRDFPRRKSGGGDPRMDAAPIISRA